MRKFNIFILFSFSLPLSLLAQTSSSAPSSYEKTKVIYYDYKTGEKRADIVFEITKKTPAGNTYLLQRTAKGSCDKFKNISWDTHAEIDEKDGLLYVVSSQCSARDKNDNMLLGYTKTFDYAKGLIYWAQSDKQGKPVKKVTFPMKGITTDDVTMAYFLRPFVKRINEPKFKSFYLLTNEPKLYKVNIKVLGYETINLPIGKKKTIVIKATADMGIVDDVLDKLIPQTYFWYEDSPSLEWLQYQGMETSMNSVYVKACVVERTTSPP